MPGLISGVTGTLHFSESGATAHMQGAAGGDVAEKDGGGRAALVWIERAARGGCRRGANSLKSIIVQR